MQTYSIAIDGIPVATGEAYSRPRRVWFGDGSLTGGNAIVEWDFVTLKNHRVSYQVCALYDQTRAVRRGAAFRSSWKSATPTVRTFPVQRSL